MTMPRDNILYELASLISRAQDSRPLRVAVDGRTASGKTTLANELASMLLQLGRTVIRTSIDGFHNPKIKRYARGRFSAEGYYLDARDLRSVRDLLLEPLGANGNRWYRTSSFDLENDVAIEQQPLLAPDDALLIVDGTFLQRPELADAWDFTIFVEVPEDVAERRGIRRDLDAQGDIVVTQRLYAERYRPAFNLYEGICDPKKNADIVWDNSDFSAPVLRRKLSAE